jgi:hypothetical protein
MSAPVTEPARLGSADSSARLGDQGDAETGTGEADGSATRATPKPARRDSSARRKPGSAERATDRTRHVNPAYAGE